MIGYAHLDRMIAAGVRTGLGDDWVRVGGMKATCDGSISERTARLSEPYVGRPDDFGIIVADEEELYGYASKAHDAGWQLGIHANGDVGISMVLDLYERLQREQPRRDPRYRIEHCTVINDTLVRRMKSLGVIPTPFSTYVYFHGEKMREYGEVRLNSMFALRSFLDAGIGATHGLGLSARTVRTDDGAAVHGHAHRDGRAGSGVRASGSRSRRHSGSAR